MPEITRALIRKRAEHNEGIISTLEELTLHQEELESINEVLGATCRRVKILYFQNNLIGKMENLTHLKELDYLNLALNNVSKIEGLQNCEHIRKLDLTANFIDVDELEASMDHLTSRDRLREMYMMGNPAQANWPHFQSYVIARLPQLHALDGTEITKSMQIQARQQLPAMQAELRKLALECRIQKAAKKEAKKEAERLKEAKMVEVEGEESDVEEVYSDATEKAVAESQELTENTPEVRCEIYREIAQQKKEKEDRENANKPRERDAEKEHAEATAAMRATEAAKEEKDIRQRNEAGYQFYWDEERRSDFVELHVVLPKHLDSSLIDVDCHPTYVSIVIKSKLLRLTLPVEVRSSEASCKRSKITGELVVKMPKVNPKETTVFVTADRQKAAAAAKAQMEVSRKPLTASDRSIKMPSLGGSGITGLEEAETTVFSAVEGSFDISPDAPAAAPGRSKARAPVARTTIRKPKKKSIQDEMLEAAAAAEAQSQQQTPGDSLDTKGKCSGITVVGESNA